MTDEPEKKPVPNEPSEVSFHDIENPEIQNRSTSSDETIEYVINPHQVNPRLDYGITPGFRNTSFLCSLIVTIHLIGALVYHYPELWRDCVQHSQENDLINLIDQDINNEEILEPRSLAYFRAQNNSLFTKEEILDDILKKTLNTIKNESEIANKLFALNLEVECFGNHAYTYEHVYNLRTDKPDHCKCEFKNCLASPIFSITENIEIMIIRFDPAIPITFESVDQFYRYIPHEIRSRFIITGVVLYEGIEGSGHFSCLREDPKRPGIWYYCSDNEVQLWNKDVREKSAKHCLYLFLRKWK